MQNVILTEKSEWTGDMTSRLVPRGLVLVFALVTGLFFLWGIPNNLNDVLIRQFMKSFALSRFQAGLIQSAFYLGYFFLALPAGFLMKRFGYKTGFITGLCLFSTGCFLFYPAAVANRYALFLAALFVVASGLAFLETAANPFIAQIGSPSTAARRLNLAQAFNPVGAILGVLCGTRFIFSGVELSSSRVDTLKSAGRYAAYLRGETERVVVPYLVLGALALAWALMIALIRFPRPSEEGASVATAKWSSLLGRKLFLFSLIAQFLYVGAQVGTWSFFIQYAQQYAHVPEKTAGLLLTATLAAFGIGRFFTSFLMRRFAAAKIMFVYALANVGLLGIALTNRGWGGVLSILLTSFFMSMMFPTIFALGLSAAQDNPKLAGSLLVMMIIGGAILTPLMGSLAEASTASGYVVPLISYIGVAAFALFCTRHREEHYLNPDVPE